MSNSDIARLASEVHHCVYGADRNSRTESALGSCCYRDERSERARLQNCSCLPIGGSPRRICRRRGSGRGADRGRRRRAPTRRRNSGTSVQGSPPREGRIVTKVTAGAATSRGDGRRRAAARGGGSCESGWVKLFHASRSRHSKLRSLLNVVSFPRKRGKSQSPGIARAKSGLARVRRA